MKTKTVEEYYGKDGLKVTGHNYSSSTVIAAGFDTEGGE